MITESQLNREVPGWREAIHSPRWPEWLRWRDPETGMRRSELLEQSNEQAIWLIHQFIATDGWMPPPRPAAPGPTYSRDEIRRNYERHRRGEYAGREAEWNSLELDMVAGAREGRVLNPVPLAKNYGDGR